MSRTIVRRLTATLTLAAVLCLAVPAVAASPTRSHSPVTLGPGLLDQVLAWLGSLCLGDGKQGQAPLEKDGAAVSGSGATDQMKPPVGDTTSSIDPNG